MNIYDFTVVAQDGKEIALAEAVDVKAESVNVPLEERTDILFLGCSYYAFGPMHKGRPNDDDLNNAKRFAKKILK